MFFKKIKLKILSYFNNLYLYRIIKRLLRRYLALPSRIIKIQESLGRIETRQILKGDFQNSEFRVFSQFGEDGILQYLINNLDIKNKIFVEFGVEDYQESNTRFLVVNDYWNGLIIDASEENIKLIKEDKIYYASNIKAIPSFITRKNINYLIESNNIVGEIGILSIDIDGNDYWIWEAINIINPNIVIVEYNSQFGPYAKVSTPYKSDFVRGINGKHMSYYGASISALTYLGFKKGYSLVASNSAGNNLFFVRDDLIKDFKVLSPAQAYKYAFFREGQLIKNGNIEYQSLFERYEEMKNYKIFNFEDNNIMNINNIKLLNPRSFNNLF